MFGDQSRRSVLKWAALGGGTALAQGLLPHSAGAQDVSTLRSSLPAARSICVFG
jgi:hypothetical protein